MISSADTGEGRIAWTTHGDGEPLLLVNGYGATGLDWDPMLLGKLARRFTVICPDNRGMGASELGSAAPSVARMADDLLAVLDALELERVVLAGWSMGGFVAQELAAAHPDRVGALALLATDPGGALATLGDAETTARLFDHSGTPRQRASRLISLLFPAGVAEEVDERFGDVVAAAREALDPAALAAQEEAMGEWYASPSEERLRSIEAPTLVAAGELDVVIPASNSRLLAERIGGARLETFAAAGHAFVAQEAPAVAGLIGELADLP